MNSGRGPIGWSDLVRALRLLEVEPGDADTTRRVIRLLGAEWKEPDSAKAPPPDQPAPGLADDLQTPSPPPVRPVAPPPSGAPLESRWSGPSPESRRRTLRPAAFSNREVPEALLRAPVFAEPDPKGKAPILPHDPLFRPNWSRHILTGMLSVRRPEGPLDLIEVTRKIGAGETFDRVPRLPWPSLKRRVHLLLDYGPGMEPFRRDQQALASEFRRVIGDPRLKTFNFKDCPSRGAGLGPVFHWKPYPRPEAGTAVVLLSDMGAAPWVSGFESADPEEWIAFARHLVEGHCAVVCVSPYPARDAPVRLRPWVTWVRWDRATSPGGIRHMLRGGLEATPSRR